MLTAELTIRLHPADDVVVARVAIAGGTVLTKERDVRVAATIPPGHKIAVRDIGEGEPVRRYNQIIGFASRGIRAECRGSHSTMSGI